MAVPEIRTEVDGRALGLTNLDKVLFPDGFTKAEVVDYYLRIAPVMLPHLLGRCLTRLRFPHGSDQPSFYEKNAPAGTPDWVPTQLVDASDTPITYPLADSSATLVWLANLAALELHTPQWTVGDARPEGTGSTRPPAADEAIRLEAPGVVYADRVVVDLDPGEGITMVDSARAALLFATALAEDGLIPFVKTSGSKGLQLFAPIHPAPWQQALGYVRSLGVRLAGQYPGRFVNVMAKQQRTERIYVDALQNQAMRNTIAPYSLRGKAFASVSTPLAWDEVAAVTSPDDLVFDAPEVLRRVAEHGDPWAEMLDPVTAAELPEAPASAN